MKSKYWAAYWTGIAWVLTNIPLVLVIFKYEPRVATKTIMLAPNQFLFLLIFFPAGVYLTVKAVITLAPLIAENARKTIFIISWFFAILLGGLFTFVDYQSDEPADYYQLTPSAAKDTVDAIKVVFDEVQKRSGKKPDLPLRKFANDIKSEREEIEKAIAKKKEKADSPNVGTLKRQETNLVSEASRYLLLVNNSESQNKYKYVDPCLRVANIIELLCALITGFQVIFWIVIIYLVRSLPGKFRLDQENILDNRDLKTPATYLVGTLGFSLFFAFGTGFNLKVRELLGVRIETTMQADDITVAVLLVLALMLIVVFTKDRFLNAFREAVPILFGIAAYLFQQFWFEKAFELVVATENYGTLIWAVVICFLMALVLFVFFIGGAHQNNNLSTQK